MKKLLSMSLIDIYEESKNFNTFDEMAIKYNVPKKYLNDIIFPIIMFKIDENNRICDENRRNEIINQVAQKANWFKSKREKKEC